MEEWRHQYKQFIAFKLKTDNLYAASVVIILITATANLRKIIHINSDYPAWLVHFHVAIQIVMKSKIH